MTFQEEKVASNRLQQFPELHVVVPVGFQPMEVSFSVGSRPSKNRKGGSGKSAGVEVYTAPGMQVHFRLTLVSCPDPFRKNREGVW